MRLEQRLAALGRTAFEELQLEERRGLNDVLGARDVGDARQLDEQLVAVVAVRGDIGFGHAELIHATVDRVVRLHHRLFAEAPGDVGAHGELVGAADRRRTIVVGGGLLLRDAAELGVFVLRDAFDPEGRWRRDVDRAHRHARGRQRLTKLLSHRLGRNAQGVVAVHPHHQMHAALEVEAELQLLGHQPRRGRQAEALREDWIDPHGGKDDDDGEDCESLPAKVLVCSHGLSVSRFLHHRLLPLIPTNGRPGDLNPDLVGNLELHR